MSATSQIQLRHLFKVFSGSTPESGKGFYWDGDIYWVTPEDVSSLTDGYKLYDTKRKITEEGYENSGVKAVPENSIVLTKRAPIGLLAILKVEACSNQGCFLLVPKEEIVSEFYYYYLLANEKYLQILGRGSTFMELSQDDLKLLKVPYLTKVSQRTIAEFLDKETRRIDDLIKEKQKQLSLLFEKRQALITRAVSKGINPNIQLKDSGNDLLGEIPEHWLKCQLKFVCDKIKTGSTPSIESMSLGDEKNIDWFTPGDFGESIYLENSKRKMSIEALSNEGYELYPANSVLLVGIGATLGKVGFIQVPAFSNQQINALVPKRNVDGRYLAFCLSIMKDFLKAYSNTATLSILNQQKTGEILIGYPPNIEEQVAIVQYIEACIDKINKVEEQTLESINLLTEKRISLITAAVTGQLQIP